MNFGLSKYIHGFALCAFSTSALARTINTFAHFPARVRLGDKMHIRTALALSLSGQIRPLQQINLKAQKEFYRFFI
jgi:hypothetical protein